MAGRNQIGNAVTALEIIRVLRRLGYDIPEEAVEQGMEQTVWPGRFSCIGDEPTFIIDGAHNEDAARKLRESVEMYFPGRRLLCIMGVFKDKEYDTASFSGLGRKYLRKNIVNGKNILTQEMINSANTRYIIQYDYDLNEETITVPEGCTLDFQGGSLNNGTINFPEGTYIRNLYKGTATITANPTYIDYLADEEDVTTENGILKFKDKEYSSSDFSGLGRKYLRKNIVDGKNILTQDMVNSSNTIYIIQYDYDLNGQTITIPEGCVLQFEGGSLSNGTLHGSNTSIITGISYIFNNIAFDGDWKVPFIYPEYFGAKGDGVTDDRNAIQKSLDSDISNTIKLLQKTYIIKSYITLEEHNYGIVIPTRKILLGSNTSNYTKDSKILISKDIDVYAFIKLKDRNTTIKDILVEGELKEDGSLI